MRRFVRDGITFAYEDELRGAPLVLLHGLGGSRAGALELAESRPELRRIALDFRGHGETVPVGPGESFRFSTFSEDVVALMAATGVESATVAGVSMGAGVALRLALDHPARVTRLILVRPAWLHTPLTDNLLPYIEIARLLGELEPEDAGEKYAASPEYDAIRAISPHAAASLAGQFERTEAPARAVCLDRMPRSAPYRNPSELNGVLCPTLVIGCERDPLHPLAFAQDWATEIPGAALELVVSSAEDITSHREAVRTAVSSFVANDLHLQSDPGA